MKKIFITIALAMVGFAASAADFAFVKDGKDLADNTTIEVGYTEVVPGVLYDWKTGIDFRAKTAGVYVFELLSSSSQFTMCPGGNCYTSGKPIELTIPATTLYDLGVHPPTGPLLESNPTKGSIVAYKKDEPDTKITINVVYYNKPVSEMTAAVADIETSPSVPAVYYNLQGVEISNPAKGELVIKRQGNKVIKILF